MKSLKVAKKLTIATLSAMPASSPLANADDTQVNLMQIGE